MSEWRYKNKSFEKSNIDVDKYVGFVYIIENLTDGRKYIGQKKFKKVRTKPVKGKVNRKKIVHDSDWRDYWGSNEELKADVIRLGPDNFRRTIIKLCLRKSEMNYEEMILQAKSDVLRKPLEYYNSYIGGRINRKQLGF